MKTELDSFESKLLATLRDHVEAAPAFPSRNVPRRQRLAVALSAVAATAAAIVVVPGLGSTPAYSVQEGNAGMIEVEVNRLEDASGLEAALADHGVKAHITYIADGGQCVPGRYTPIPRRGISLTMGSDLFRISLEPGTVRDNEILVVDASIVRSPDRVEPTTGLKETDRFRTVVQAELTHGPVPPCVPMSVPTDTLDP